jgi:hypothetical protein
VITTQLDAPPAIAKLETLKKRLRTGVGEAVESAAARLRAIVQAKLSGEVLKARSGALRDSIRAAMDADGTAARVFSDGSVPYARVQEYGGRVNVPAMAPVNAKALAFAYGGRMVFAKHAAAHVVSLPECSYLRSSLAEFAPVFLDDIRKVVTENLA